MPIATIGSKIFVADLRGLENFLPALSLGIIFSTIAAGVVWGFVETRRTGTVNDREGSKVRIASR